MNSVAVQTDKTTIKYYREGNSST